MNSQYRSLILAAVRCLVGLVVSWCAIALVTNSAAAAATTRYVSKKGNDFSNTQCSQSKPCLTVNHAVVAAASGDTIKIEKGTFIEFPITISKNLTLEGTGAAKTVIDGNHAGTVFVIPKNITATIKQLKIRNGKTTGVDGLGGGIRNYGTLTVQKVYVRDNQAHLGAGIYNDGVLTLQKVTLAHNQAAAFGGGLYSFINGTVALVNVGIIANRANVGAGIYNAHTLVASLSTVAGNTKGGGIASDGTLVLVNTTISGNSDPGHTGDGLAILGGTAQLIHVTVTNNPGSPHGGIYVTSGFVWLYNSIVYGNGPNPQCGTAKIGRFSDGGYNVLADQSCSYWPGSGSILANPRLGPLADNGGYNLTHALTASSPAIDLVPTNRCVSTDERGVARPINGDGKGKARCDAGAFEYEP